MIRSALSSIVFLVASIAAYAQGTFQNLDFEAARGLVTPTAVNTYGGTIDPAVAFPSWTVGTDGTLGRNFTLYNDLTLGSVAQVLVGPDYPTAIGYSALQGLFSALLQYGPSPTAGVPSLSQIGLVPAGTRSINFLVSSLHNDARVTLGGVDIPLVSTGGGRMAGDISAFAGQVTELTFSTTSYSGSWLYFDDVRFSTQAAPEPAAPELLLIGGLLVLLRCWQRRGSKGSGGRTATYHLALQRGEGTPGRVV